MADRETQWAAWMRAADDGDEAAYRRLLEALAPAVRATVLRALARAGAGTADAEEEWLRLEMLREELEG